MPRHAQVQHTYTAMRVTPLSWTYSHVIHPSRLPVVFKSNTQMTCIHSRPSRRLAKCRHKGGGEALAQEVGTRPTKKKSTNAHLSSVLRASTCAKRVRNSFPMRWNLARVQRVTCRPGTWLFILSILSTVLSLINREIQTSSHVSPRMGPFNAGIDPRYWPASVGRQEDMCAGKRAIMP